jgi:hypothetical protein
MVSAEGRRQTVSLQFWVKFGRSPPAEESIFSDHSTSGTFLGLLSNTLSRNVAGAVVFDDSRQWFLLKGAARLQAFSFESFLGGQHLQRSV